MRWCDKPTNFRPDTKQKDVLFSKFSDIVHLAIPGKEIRPKEQRDAKQLVQRGPE